MKADPDVKMISAEAPILFAKGCDIFITELTMRAWIHAEENKRRTLQRSDIASALAKSDMFDFLIDIVPREEAASHSKRSTNQSAGAPTASAPAVMGAQIPSQTTVPSASHQHQQAPQHNLAHAQYPLGNSQLQTDQEFRPPPSMYTSQIPQDPNAYGQSQQELFESQSMYGYAPMAATQQVRAFASIRLLGALTDLVPIMNYGS